MAEAIRLSIQKMKQNHGGPFGAVVVRKGEILARGFNRVTSSLDPTAHAEIVAIRRACRRLGTFKLSDCELYASCEPCPMCLAAIYWARIKKLYYASTSRDAAKIGFDDRFLYREMTRTPSSRKLLTRQIMRKEALEAFKEWVKKPDKIPY